MLVCQSVCLPSTLGCQPNPGLIIHACTHAHSIKRCQSHHFPQPTVLGIGISQSFTLVFVSYLPDAEDVFLAVSEVWRCNTLLLTCECKGSGRSADEPGNLRYGPMSWLTTSQPQSQRAGRPDFEAQGFSEASIKYSESCFIHGHQINNS